MTLPKIPLDDPRVVALARARQNFAADCLHYDRWEELTDDDRADGLPAARNYLESAVRAGLVPDWSGPAGPLVKIRQPNGEPITRDQYAASLRRAMDRDRGERRPSLDAGEAHAVASLLDELAALCPGDDLGRLARELAVRINDRHGV